MSNTLSDASRLALEAVEASEMASVTGTRVTVADVLLADQAITLSRIADHLAVIASALNPEEATR